MYVYICEILSQNMDAVFLVSLSLNTVYFLGPGGTMGQKGH